MAALPGGPRIGVDTGNVRAGGQAFKPGGVGLDPDEVGDPEGAVFDSGGGQQVEEGALGAGGGLLQLLDDELPLLQRRGQILGGAEVGLPIKEDEELEWFRGGLLEQAGLDFGLPGGLGEIGPEQAGKEGDEEGEVFKHSSIMNEDGDYGKAGEKI